MYSLFAGIGKESSVDRRFYLFSHLLTLLISQFWLPKGFIVVTVAFIALTNLHYIIYILVR
jgi:hypothetical protein